MIQTRMATAQTDNTINCTVPFIILHSTRLCLCLININNVPIANIELLEVIMEMGKDGTSGDDINSIDSNQQDLFLDVIKEGTFLIPMKTVKK